MSLNVVNGTILGIFSAAIWAWVLIRRSIRAERPAVLSKTHRLMAWAAAVLMFLPAVFIGFATAFPLIDIFVRPGPWIGLVMALSVVFSVGIVGAIVTWLAAFVTLKLCTALRRA